MILVFPIDIENKSAIKSIKIPNTEGIIYIYSFLSSFWLHIFAIHPVVNSGISKSTGWAIIEELSIRRRVRTFLVSWGQTIHVKNCYVDLSSSYHWLWVLVSNNIYRYERNFGSFYHNPPILETVSIASMCQHGPHWEFFFTEIQQQGIILALEYAYG